jgi:hypothetical protein
MANVVYNLVRVSKRTLKTARKRVEELILLLPAVVLQLAWMTTISCIQVAALPRVLYLQGRRCASFTGSEGSTYIFVLKSLRNCLGRRAPSQKIVVSNKDPRVI